MYYIKQGIFEDLSEINLNNQIIILFSLQENIKILKNLIPSQFQTLSFFFKIKIQRIFGRYSSGWFLVINIMPTFVWLCLFLYLFFLSPKKKRGRKKEKTVQKRWKNVFLRTRLNQGFDYVNCLRLDWVEWNLWLYHAWVFPLNTPEYSFHV